MNEENVVGAFLEGLVLELTRGARPLESYLIWPKNFPVYSGTVEQVAEVSMGYLGITDATDLKPLVATSGLGTCLSLFGEDTQNDIGFLMHVTPKTDLGDAFNKLKDNLRRRYGKDSHYFNLWIVISQFVDRYKLEETVRFFEGNNFSAYLYGVYMGIMKFTINYGQMREGKPGQGIALDTRTGQVFTYLSDSVKDIVSDPNYNISLSNKA